MDRGWRDGDEEYTTLKEEGHIQERVRRIVVVVGGGRRRYKSMKKKRKEKEK